MFMRRKIKLLIAILALGFLLVPAVPSTSVSADPPRCWVDGSETACPDEDVYIDDSCYQGDRTDGELNLVTCPQHAPICYSSSAPGTTVACPTDGTVEDNFCYTDNGSGGFDVSPCPGNTPGLGEDIDAEITTSCDAEVLNRDNCKIIDYLVIGINFLSAVAGMAITASIMIAGYQYMTARDNAGQIQAARTRITWAIVALLIFIFMYGFLNWLVPGGVL